MGFMQGNGCCLLPKSLEVEQTYKDIAYYRGRKHGTSVTENQIWLKIFIDCPSVSSEVEIFAEKQTKKMCLFSIKILYIFFF